jgi:hypothetical protein
MFGQGMFWGLKINERSHAPRFNISKGYPNIFDLLETDGDSSFMHLSKTPIAPKMLGYPMYEFRLCVKRYRGHGRKGPRDLFFVFGFRS